MRIGIIALLLALALPACSVDTGSRLAPSGPDAACPPMPTECPVTLECSVTTNDDGLRVCSGESCCQTFCEDNGCGACCNRPSN